MSKRIIQTLLMVMVILTIPACSGSQGMRRAGGRRLVVGYSIVQRDDLVYIASNDGFLVYRFNDAENTTKIAEFQADTAFGIFLEEDVVYLASRNQLITVDVSDPANPARLSSYRVEGIAFSVLVEGGYAYLVGSEGGIILDVSDPADPAFVSRFSEGLEVAGIELSDSTLYVAVPSRGLQLIDVSDPSLPNLMETVSGTQGVENVHVTDQYLYAACHQQGVKIIEISDSFRPRVIGSFRDDDGGEALAVWEQDGILYVADNYQIEALDLEDPANPRQIWEYKQISAAHDLVGDGAYLYIAAGSFLILEIEL